MDRRLACIVGPLLGALLGVAASAYGQDAASNPAPDPTVDVLVHLLQGGGLPAVLALLGWWGRGLLASGIPLRVELHDTDRTELRRIRRALERDETPDEPPPRAA